MPFSQATRFAARIVRGAKIRGADRGRGLSFSSTVFQCLPAVCGAQQRHVLYRAAPCEIDLLIEARPESNRLMITGQLMDTSSDAVFRRGLRISLWDGHQSFVSLRTNAWGEFLGEIEDSGELVVSLKIQTREIVISVQNLTPKPA